MSKKSIKEIVAEELDVFLKQNGYELYHIEFVKEAKDWYLRIFIDRSPSSGEEGIGTDDCEKVSRFISERLDTLDPIEKNYYLEVSSPGLDRPLLVPEHYQKYSGREVDFILFKALNGKKAFTALLKGIEENQVNVMLDGTETGFSLDQIAKARLTIVF